MKRAGETSAPSDYQDRAEAARAYKIRRAAVLIRQGLSASAIVERLGIDYFELRQMPEWSGMAAPG
jgi:hypothetical protein